MTEVRHTGGGRFSQRGRFIQGCYIQWALYILKTGPKGQLFLAYSKTAKQKMLSHAVYCHTISDKSCEYKEALGGLIFRAALTIALFE